MTKVFIDGQEGTTGLRIADRLAQREDITLISIDPELRKDAVARKECINESEVTILCLPDAAAIDAVSLVDSQKKVKLIDASTAHRINPEWVYGLPELATSQRSKIANSTRIAVPGCYASGFISLTAPLVQAGIIPSNYPVSCHAISGYSGGGKKMIADYQATKKSEKLFSPRMYGLTQAHKHMPEMKHHSGLSYPPVFNPIVDDYYSGMMVSVPLSGRLLRHSADKEAVWTALYEHYIGYPADIINVAPLNGDKEAESGFLSANSLSNTDGMKLYVLGSREQFTLAACFDNLGKGASGAAIQCMNIAIGAPEDKGLIL